MKTTFLFAVILTTLASCQSATEFDPTNFEVQELQLTEHPGGAKILTGSLTNHSARDITVAQIQFTLFDSDNRAISTMSVVVRDISAGQAIPFRAAVDSDLDVVGARTRQVLIP